MHDYKEMLNGHKMHNVDDFFGGIELNILDNKHIDIHRSIITLAVAIYQNNEIECKTF